MTASTSLVPNDLLLHPPRTIGRSSTRPRGDCWARPSTGSRRVERTDSWPTITTRSSTPTSSISRQRKVCSPHF